MMGLAIAVDGFGMKRVWIEAVGELGQRSYAQRDTKLDCVFAQGSRLKPLLQQQHQLTLLWERRETRSQ